MLYPCCFTYHIMSLFYINPLPHCNPLTPAHPASQNMGCARHRCVGYFFLGASEINLKHESKAGWFFTIFSCKTYQSWCFWVFLFWKSISVSIIGWNKAKFLQFLQFFLRFSQFYLSIWDRIAFKTESRGVRGRPWRPFPYIQDGTGQTFRPYQELGTGQTVPRYQDLRMAQTYQPYQNLLHLNPIVKSKASRWANIVRSVAFFSATKPKTAKETKLILHKVLPLESE